MIDVDVSIQNHYVRFRFNCLRDAVDGFVLATFTKVWYTLDETIFDF